MTTCAPSAAPRPALPALVAGWAGTLTRPGAGLGLWAPALAGHPSLALLALAALAAAALLRAL